MTNSSSSKDVPKNPAIRRAWVVFQLRIRGLSLGMLAHQEGVSRQAMSHALIGPSSHLQPVIAEAIALPVQDVWPEWWRPDGTPWGRTNVRHRNTRRRARNVQSERAA